MSDSDQPATVTIVGDQVLAVSPEGKKARIPVSHLMEEINSLRHSAGGLILPEGVRTQYPTKNGLVLVHETSPRFYNFQWITKDSPAPYGPEAKYESVRVLLPYVVILCLVVRDRRGTYQLTNWNEAFFRNETLLSENDPLYYPALLNCSKIAPQKEHALSWICTQHLDKSKIPKNADPSCRIKNCLSALLHHLYESGFNLSSEHHELTSWFSATVEAKIDPRIASIEAWAKASEEDKMFSITVPWLPTGHTVKEVAHRMINLQKIAPQEIAHESDFSRLIFRHTKKKKSTASSAIEDIFDFLPF